MADRAAKRSKLSLNAPRPASERRKVEAGLALDLPAVLRADAPAFDLEATLARFDQLWQK